MSHAHFSVKIDSADQVDDRLDYLAKTLVERDKWPVLLDVRPETRTAAMNRFLWGWLYRRTSELLNDAGIAIELEDGSTYPYTPDMLHDIGKRKLLVRETLTTKDGQRFTVTWSTKELGRREKDVEGTTRPSFKWYVDNFKRLWFERYGIICPEPPLRVSDYADIMDELRGAE